MNWILCPLHNSLHLTKAALRSFLQQDINSGVNVLMLDNASRDNTPSWLSSLQDDRVWPVLRTSPLSVAASWNLMLKWVFAQGAEYALVVNNDVELRSDTYKLLVADGGLFVTAVGTADKSKIEPPYNEPDPACKRKHPDFSCFLIRRECFERVGTFDESLKGAYTEDSDFHIRMHRAGIEAVCLDLPFYHVGAGTIKNADPDEVKRIQQHADQNRALFREKYGVEVGSPQYYELFGHGEPA